MYVIWVIGNIFKTFLCIAICQQVSINLKIHFPANMVKSANVPKRSSVNFAYRSRTSTNLKLYSCKDGDKII